MKRLQVKKDGKWEYVFCYVPTSAHPVITKDPHKALLARDFEYFQNKFANHEFRVI